MLKSEAGQHIYKAYYVAKNEKNNTCSSCVLIVLSIYKCLWISRLDQVSKIAA